MNQDALVADDLWEAIAPLAPEEPPKPEGGRPRVPDRGALAGIVFVLRTGCPWRRLPKELGCGSGTTCWRRPRDWLGDEAAIDWSRASADSISVRAKRRAKPPAPTRRIRAKAGSKHHLAVDRTGIPLAVRLSAANVHDSTQLLPLVDVIPPIIGPRGRPGRPRKRPAKLHADRAYDFPALRRDLRARGITPRIARRGIDASERLGRHRWVVERTFAWLLGCRRLGLRYERRADLLRGLLHLPCALIRVRFLGLADG